MRKEEIISKGIYTGAQYPELVSVKQYIIFRKDGEKHLLLRLSNDRNETVNSLRLKINQLDVKGNILNSQVYTFDGLNAGGNKAFALGEQIKIEDSCVDFHIETVSAKYGEYTYTLKNGELFASYEGSNEEIPVNKEELRKKLNGKSQKLLAKTLHAPKMILFSMLAALLLIVAFSYAQLRYFMSTEETFTLENVEYAFTTDDREHGPISIISYKGKAGNIIIPAEIEGHKVESVAEGAFMGKRIVSVLVEGDTFIGDSAFEECKHLETVDISNVTSLGDGVFKNCGSVTSVKMSSSLTKISDGLFEGCSSLEKIELPSTLTDIGDRAFAGCESLAELVIPDSVVNVGAEILRDCEKISNIKAPFLGKTVNNPKAIFYFFGDSITADAPNSLKSVTITGMTVIPAMAFYDCSSLTSVSFPDNVTEIGQSAFNGCDSLKSFTVPSKVSKIGITAFRGCKSLEEITIPSQVNELPMGVFSGCKSLKNITLPSSLLTIRENAFESCVGISGLIIPTSVKTIDKNALKGCTGLKDLTISFIGETVEKPYTLADLFGTYDIKLENIRVRGAKYIGSNTFSGFNSLVSVNIGGIVESIDNYCFSDCKNLKSVVLSDTVTSIGNGAFFNCEALESIDLPDNITYIPDNAFTSCSSLNDIDIPEGVTEIGIQAFKGCTSLENIDWLSNITNLGYGAFEGCKSVESAEINSAITVIPAQIFKGCIGITSIKLPDATVEINAEAFEGCEKLAQITVPDSVTSVGEKAFAECTSLTELVISDKAISLGEGFADSCTGIKEITIPFLGSNVDSDSTLSYVFGDTLPEGLKKITITADNSIADKAFYGCVSLEEISLNEGIESIGSCAFSNCTGITSITIPESVASIGSRAFEFTSLTSLTVPNNTTSLGNEIVRGVTTIEEISVPHIGNTKEKVSSLALLFNGGSVPDNLRKITVTNSTSIEERAFYGCRYIEEIVLDCDITEMGSYAFGECSSLVKITLPDTLTTVGEYCFYYDEKLESIVFPDSVEYFGRNVLYGCNNIAAVTVPFVGLERNDANSFYVLFTSYNWEFPDSVKSITVTNETTVKNYSFQSLGNVEEIIYTKGMEAIGTSAFGGCYRLKTIELGDSLKTIDDWAFESCMNIDTVVLPESLEHIGMYAFISCYNLNEVYNFSDIQINTYDNTCLRNYCMAYRTDDTPVTKVKANGLEFILGDNGLWYFNKYDKGIEEIVFPLSFMNGEEEITEYNIPNYSFTRNKNIKSVTLTKAIKSIEYDTFYGCDNLRQVYNLSDLDLVRGSYTHGYVAYYAYVIHNNADAEKLVEVTIDDFVFTKTGNEWFLIKYTGTAEKITLGEFSYGDTTVSSYEITDGVFRYSSISELVITDVVKKLGNESFYNITNLKKVSFEDNSSITVIPSNCFSYCYALEQVVLPSSLTKIEYGAFENCNDLIEIYNLSEMELTIGSTDNGSVARYAFIIHESMDEEPLTETRIDKILYWHSGDLWVIKSYSGTDKKLELGSFEYNGKIINAYSIMSEAFSYNSYLEEIIIGDEVKSIGEGAFKSCYNLKKVSFENNTSITVIPQSAFMWSRNLEMVILPSSLESIDSQAFSDCQKLIELYNLSDLELECGSYDHGNVARYAYVIHKSMDETPLQNIAVEGYQFMSDGDSIWLFNGYTGEKDTLDFKGLVYNEKEIKGITVMPYSLQDNTVVKKLILGEEIAKLSPNAFNGSTFLTYVSLKDCENITIIPENAFSYCRNLSTVILSKHITGIMYDAFWESNSIYNVCNLSSLEITAGSDMHGYIAKYAKNVCTSEDDIIEITYVESGNQIYQFINEDGEWNLISSSAVNSYQSQLILPELIIGEESVDYNVKISLPNCSYLVIPETVKSIENADSISVNCVMYFGQGTVLGLFDNNPDEFNTCCYAKCVHKDGQWSYDENDNIITYFDVDSRYIKFSTCTETGKIEYTCRRCNEKWEEEARKQTHNPGFGGKCMVCGAKLVKGSIFEYFHVTNDADYPFTIIGNDSLVSTNKDHNTKAVIELVAKKDVNIYFKVNVSSELYNDYCHIMRDNVYLDSLSGDIEGQYVNVCLSAGEALTITYRKNYQNSSGDDKVEISEICYFEE